MSSTTKLLTSLLLLTGLLISASEVNAATNFSDVKSDHWASDAISWGVQNNVLSGYEDGTFKPDKNITGVEFLTMFVKAVTPNDIRAPKEGDRFWYSPVVDFAKDKNWSTAFSRNDFVRSEVASVFTQSRGLSCGERNNVQFILNDGLSNGKTAPTVDGFDLKGNLTRAEAVMFVSNYSQKYNDLKENPRGGLEGDGCPLVENSINSSTLPEEVSKPATPSTPVPTTIIPETTKSSTPVPTTIIPETTESSTPVPTTTIPVPTASTSVPTTTIPVPIIPVPTESSTPVPSEPVPVYVAKPKPKPTADWIVKGNYSISSNKTSNSLINLYGSLPKDKEVMVLAKKDGKENKQVFSTHGGELNIELALHDGPGLYNIAIYERELKATGNFLSTAVYGTKAFQVTNADSRDMSFLLPTKYIQSNDPEIVALANYITRNVTDNVYMKKTQLIHDWVAQNITYDVKGWTTNTFQLKTVTALDTLHDRNAVCQGYALLTAALNRAVGIKAKVISGGGYWSTELLNAAPANETNHAWIEVFVDGRWVVQDPTWDSGYVSPTNSSDGYSWTTRLSEKYFDPNPSEFAKNHRKVEEELVY
jgi:transglutaminase-like putative cysteine protease